MLAHTPIRFHCIKITMATEFKQTGGGQEGRDQAQGGGWSQRPAGRQVELHAGARGKAGGVMASRGVSGTDQTGCERKDGQDSRAL